MKRKLVPVGILIVVLVGIYGAYRLFRTPDPTQLTKVTCRLDWAPGAEHSFLYLAKEKGYFKDAGLDVNIQAGDGSTTSAKLVGSGAIDYALCSGDTALIAASAGAPVRVVAVLYSQPPTVILSRKDRNITKPKDLEGKTYGANMKSTTYKQFLAFCQASNVDLAKVKVLPTAGRASDILTDAVDASGGYAYIQPVQCEVAGVPVNEMWLSDHGVRPYSMSVIANKDNMSPEVTRKFLAALLRAFSEMVQEDPAAFDAFLKAHPTANKEFESKKLQKVCSFVQKNLKSQGNVGAQTLEGWIRTQDFLLTQKLLDKEIDLKQFFTTDFLPPSEGQ